LNKRWLIGRQSLRTVADIGNDRTLMFCLED
jgi:hypothetical protein